MTFSEQFKHYRELTGKTQEEVGYEVEMPTPSISRIERGAGCNIKTAFKLAKAVGMKTIIVD
jgi:DNA-binding XRE family transcriptional regulator